VLVVNSFDDLQKARGRSQGQDRVVRLRISGEPFAPMVGYRDAGGLPRRCAVRGRQSRRGCGIDPVRHAAVDAEAPHTGSTRYDTTVAKIPAAALSVEDAEMLHRMQNRGEPIRVTLKMSAKQLARRAVTKMLVAELPRIGKNPTKLSCLAGISTRGTWAKGRWTTAAASVAAWEAVRLDEASSASSQSARCAW